MAKDWSNCFLPVRKPPSFIWHIFIFTSILKITCKGMLSFVKRCFLEGHVEASCSLELSAVSGWWRTLHRHTWAWLPGWWYENLLCNDLHLSRKWLSLRSQPILQVQRDSETWKSLGVPLWWESGAQKEGVSSSSSLSKERDRSKFRTFPSCPKHPLCPFSVPPHLLINFYVLFKYFCYKYRMVFFQLAEKYFLLLISYEKSCFDRTMFVVAQPFPGN